MKLRASPGRDNDLDESAASLVTLGVSPDIEHGDVGDDSGLGTLEASHVGYVHGTVRGTADSWSFRTLRAEMK